MTQGSQAVRSLYLREEETATRRMDRPPQGTARYRSTIAAGSLKVAESRTIADLLLRGVQAHDWRRELVEKNVLQIRSLETAARLGQLLRARLELMQPALREMVRDGSALLATHADARRTIEGWRVHYNTVRPHSPLGFLTQEQFRVRPAEAVGIIHQFPHSGVGPKFGGMSPLRNRKAGIIRQ